MWLFKYLRGREVRSRSVGFLFLLLMALAFLQIQCGENPLQPDPRGPNEVWILSSGFDPATLTVSAGTTVTWSNKDNVRHDITSGLPDNVENLFLASNNLNTNEQHSVTFSQRRTFNYFCTRHRNTGKIVVQ